jgi:hypothetical protein
MAEPSQSEGPIVRVLEELGENEQKIRQAQAVLQGLLSDNANLLKVGGGRGGGLPKGQAAVRATRPNQLQ